MRHLKNSIYNNSIVFITVVETKNFSAAAGSYGEPYTPEELIPHLGISRVMDDFSIPKEVIFTHKSGRITVLKNTTRLFTNSVLMDYFLVKSDHVIVGGCDTLYEEELAAGRIVNIMPDYELGPNISFYLVYNNRQEKNQILLNLINYIEQMFTDDKLISTILTK